MKDVYRRRYILTNKTHEKICTIQIKRLTLHRKNAKDGAIAQLVEHRTENPCVPGSNPGGTTEDR